MPPEVKIDPQTLKDQTAPLTEEQNDLIAEQAMKELELENETPEVKKEREETEAKETEAQEETATALADRAKEAGLEEGASEEDIEATELKGRAKAVGLEEDANLEDVETKELVKRAVAVGLAEDASLEDIETKEAESKPSEEEEKEKKEADRLAKEEDTAIIKALMTPDKDGKKLAETEDQAKEILEKDKAVIEKFEGNKIKLARSYREIQGRATKAEEQVKQVQGTMQQFNEQRAVEAKVDLPTVKNLIIDGKISDSKGGYLTEKQIIDAAKANNPSQTRDMDDEQIVEFAAEKIRDAYSKGQETLKADRMVKASAKRDELISNLPENAKEFEAEVKAEVAKFPDAQILSPAFNLDDVVLWAKGNKYDALKAQMDTARQEGHDSGLKKGQEEAKSLGEKITKPKGKGKPSKSSSGLARVMSTREQQRARDMYDSIDIPEKEKFKMYIEQYPKENEEFKQ